MKRYVLPVYALISALLLFSACIKVEAAELPQYNHTVCVDGEDAFDGAITTRMDLSNRQMLYLEDMKYLEDYYVRIHPDSALKNTAQAFIDASNATGLDPIFLFCLCGLESGWGTSKVHVAQNNPYSLGMWSVGDSNGYSVGDSFSQGIVNGAVTIWQEFYLNGQTDLYSMNHFGNHSYANPNSTFWEDTISSEMTFCYRMLAERSMP